MTPRRPYQRPRISDSFAIVDEVSAGDARGGPATAARTMDLRDLRERRALSIDALAELSGISVATISRIERGKTTQPRPYVVRRLSAALGVAPWSISEFLPVVSEIRLRDVTIKVN